MHQLGVIRDKQAFSAAEVVWKEYFFCGPSPGMFWFISNDLWNIPWFFAHYKIPNSLITTIFFFFFFLGGAMRLSKFWNQSSYHNDTFALRWWMDPANVNAPVSWMRAKDATVLQREVKSNEHSDICTVKGEASTSIYADWVNGKWF